MEVHLTNHLLKEKAHKHHTNCTIQIQTFRLCASSLHLVRSQRKQALLPSPMPRVTTISRRLLHTCEVVCISLCVLTWSYDCIIWEVCLCLCVCVSSQQQPILCYVHVVLLGSQPISYRVYSVLKKKSLANIRKEVELALQVEYLQQTQRDHGKGRSQIPRSTTIPGARPKVARFARRPDLREVSTCYSVLGVIS